MKSIPDQQMPHKSPLPQPDPATFEHDSSLCARGYETACPHCRERFYPDEFRQAKRVSSARVAIVDWLTRLTGADPEEVCRAIREIVGDVIVDDQTGGGA